MKARRMAALPPKSAKAGILSTYRRVLVRLLALVALLACGRIPALQAQTQILDLDAASLAGLSNGAAVTTWPAVTGPNGTGVIRGGSSGPTYVASFPALNNLPVVNFNGNSTNGTTSGCVNVSFTSSYTQPLTFFVVSQIYGNVHRNGTASSTDNDFLFDSQGSSRIVASLSNDGQNANSGGPLGIYAGTVLQDSATGTTATADRSGANVYECDFNGSSSSLYSNKIQLGPTGNAGSDGITTAGGLRIGANNDYQYGLYGVIGQFVVFQGSMTAFDRNAVGYALASKFGLSTSYVPTTWVGASASWNTSSNWSAGGLQGVPGDATATGMDTVAFNGSARRRSRLTRAPTCRL